MGELSYMVAEERTAVLVVAAHNSGKILELPDSDDDGGVIWQLASADVALDVLDLADEGIGPNGHPIDFGSDPRLRDDREPDPVGWYLVAAVLVPSEGPSPLKAMLGALHGARTLGEVRERVRAALNAEERS